MDTVAEQGEVIYIQLLGGFRLSVGEHAVSDSTGRTKQVWNLLEYLIAFRHHTVSQEELIQVLWRDEDSENPVNALKNLVYRVRELFKKNAIPFAKEIITFRAGTYHWNNDLPCVIDTEEFERVLRLAADTTLIPAERITRYLLALSLYKGNFLPESAYDEWVVPLTNYYRTLYFKGVHEAVALLTQLERFEEARNLCEKAIVMDPFEEQTHQELILVLSRLGRHSEALSHYTYITELFYRELAVKPSDALRKIYREIVKSVNSIETDLNVIKEDLAESKEEKGAYYCGYEVFRNIYRIEARATARNGQSTMLVLFTLSDLHNNTPSIESLGKLMDLLLECLYSTLRRGDIVARFSATQFVTMLSSLTFEDGEGVVNRLLGRFYDNLHEKNITLHASLQPLDPIPEAERSMTHT